jgi:IS1 family transposase
VDRDRNEIVAHYVGNGDLGAATQLYDQVRHHDIKIAATDGNYSYDKVIPKHTRHIIDKAETCLVEAKNSSLRDMLARLNRRTKRYSKCPVMLRQAIAMWRFSDIAQSIYC